MKTYYEENGIKIYNADCLEAMKQLGDSSVDAVVCDPPYELTSGKNSKKGFMGKEWDGTGIAYNIDVWKECLRVLKPGGHLLAFGGTRTYHRMAVAIEDAGFEIRDMIEWIYGSGFPKSHNIALAIDKKNGTQGQRGVGGFNVGGKGEQENRKANLHIGSTTDGSKQKGYSNQNNEWNGWGTALKPSHEPIVMARKPLSEKTIAENILKHGTGGINIDECRVNINKEDNKMLDAKSSKKFEGVKPFGNTNIKGSALKPNPQGRFPANLIHNNSEEVRACFPDTGISKKGSNKGTKKNMFGMLNTDTGNMGFGDKGSASRYFKSIIYQPKASKRERGDGNSHPTVKSLALMEYLITMVSHKDAVILDPFMGSGTTLIAVKKLKRKAIGIELSEEYCKIAIARIRAVHQTLL